MASCEDAVTSIVAGTLSDTGVQREKNRRFFVVISYES